MAIGLTAFTARTGTGAGEPVLDTQANEELKHLQQAVSIALGNRAPEPSGTLYITSKQVIWLSDVDRAKGFSVDFYSLSLHAVSRDPDAYPLPCIYAQIETGDDDNDDEPDCSDSEEKEALDLSKVKEIRLIPSDPSKLDMLFQVFCECAELNPEPLEVEEEEEHEWIFSADQMVNGGAVDEPSWEITENPGHVIGYSNGDHDLVHSVIELQIDDNRFEDADEVEHHVIERDHHREVVSDAEEHDIVKLCPLPALASSV